MTDLRELGKELPWDRPEPARREALRAALLEAASEAAPVARRRWVVTGIAFASGVLAAAAVALLVVHRDEPRALELPDPAQITASAEARFEHRFVATATGVDEVVQLHAGTLQIASERVHLRARDAEVVGAGSYEVEVAGDALARVHVQTGRAEIRVTGQQTVLLAAGQTWRASVITSDLSPEQPPKVATTDVRKPDAPSTDVRKSDADALDVRKPNADRVARSTPKMDQPTVADRVVVKSTSDADRVAKLTPKSDQLTDVRKPDAPADTSPQPVDPNPPKRNTGPSAIEKRFQHGWSLLKQGKAREAAFELGAAADLDPADPLAADARYLQAVALVRAGERSEAERVLVKFLDNAPKSLRRGRAAVLLGRLLGDRGDLASARAWLESAVADPDPAIAAAARAGLQALAKP
jgi:TolA-binding protein